MPTGRGLELRHSYVSLMHDAGHLLEGHEVDAAERFEDYLPRAVSSTPIP
jgi:hypothetical protein